jgi:hypothetical protein
MYCFGIHQPLFEEMEKTIPNITFQQGLPSPEVIDEFTADRRHRLIVLDDLSRTEREHGIVIYPGMSPPQTERRVRHTEHFPQRNEIENHRIKHDISRHDENIRDVSQVTTMGRQLFP